MLAALRLDEKVFASAISGYELARHKRASIASAAQVCATRGRDHGCSS